jgi:hypothetical protein
MRQLHAAVFHSLAELNAAIGEMLRRLNDERPIRRLGVTRRQLFDEIEKPALKALPVAPYVFASRFPVSTSFAPLFTAAVQNKIMTLLAFGGARGLSN